MPAPYYGCAAALPENRIQSGYSRTWQPAVQPMQSCSCPPNTKTMSRSVSPRSSDTGVAPFGLCLPFGPALAPPETKTSHLDRLMMYKTCLTSAVHATLSCSNPFEALAGSVPPLCHTVGIVSGPPQLCRPPGPATAPQGWAPGQLAAAPALLSARPGGHPCRHSTVSGISMFCQANRFTFQQAVEMLV